MRVQAIRIRLRKAIRNQCVIFDEDGLSEIGVQWLEYVTALKAHVEMRSGEG